jgi:UPF0042 nucleotide-binding protein
MGAVTDVLVITGLSGAGRSQAADDLEDLGWFVVDNLPLELLDKIVELGSGKSRLSRLGLVIGPNSSPAELLAAISRLRTSHRVIVLFLDASTPELVRRYGSTRRRHPLDDATSGLADTVERERALLEPVKAVAIWCRHDGAERAPAEDADPRDVRRRRGWRADADRVTSFGYKQGLPLDVDLVMDVRFLPNPHWIPELRPLTGSTHRCALRLRTAGDDGVPAALRAPPRPAPPAYAAEGKSYLSIAIGCTGGRHRSVALVEELAGGCAPRGCVRASRTATSTTETPAYGSCANGRLHRVRLQFHHSTRGRDHDDSPGRHQRVRSHRPQLLPRGEAGGGDLDIVAVNDLGALDVMAHLLKYDSVLGVLPQDIKATSGGISVDGRRAPGALDAQPERAAVG